MSQSTAAIQNHRVTSINPRMKISKDTLGIANTDLDVRLFEEPRIGVNLLALKEHGPDRVEIEHPVFGIFHALAECDQFVDLFNDGPVQATIDAITGPRHLLRVHILWHLLPENLAFFRKERVALFGETNGGLIQEVQAIAEVDDGTNHRRRSNNMLVGAAFLTNHVRGPFHGSCIVVLPEIRAAAQPVVVILTGVERQNFLADHRVRKRLVAPMEAENK